MSKYNEVIESNNEFIKIKKKKKNVLNDFNKNIKEKEENTKNNRKKELNKKIYKAIAEEKITKDSVTFSKKHFKNYEIKIIGKHPINYFWCLFFSLTIALLIAICIYGMIQGAGLIYGIHIKSVAVKDLENLFSIFDEKSADDVTDFLNKNGDNFTIGGGSGNDFIPGGNETFKNWISRILVTSLVKSNDSTSASSTLLSDYYQSLVSEFFKNVYFDSGDVYLEFKGTFLEGYEIFLNNLVLIYVVCFVIILLCFYLQYLFAANIGSSIEKNLKINIIRKMMFEDYAFYIDNVISDLINTYTSGPTLIGQHIKNCFTIKLNIATTIISVLSITAYSMITASSSGTDFSNNSSMMIEILIYSLLNIIILALIILTSYAGTIFNSRAVIKLDFANKINNLAMSERIIMSRIIKSSGTWDQEFSESIEEISANNKRKYLSNYGLAIWTSLILTSIIGYVFLQYFVSIAYFGYQGSKLLIASQSSFIAGALVIMAQLYPLQKYSNVKQESNAYMIHINKILTNRIQIEKFKDTGKKFKGFKTSIEFKNIAFSYPDEPEKVLVKNLSLRILKGEKVGIIGQSGCGKSTLIKLLLGYYKPLEGSIFVDGIDLESYNLVSWLNHVAYVDQRPQLLTLSVFENLTYGIKKFSTEEVVNATKKARIFDQIMSLPNKFEEIIQESGEKMSGGQKQRFVIARMIIKKPDIVLLDEATAKLDNITEIEVMGEIVDILNSEKITCLSICHRLNSLNGFDKVIKMSPFVGITHQGTFDEMVRVTESLKFLDPIEFRVQKQKENESLIKY